MVPFWYGSLYTENSSVQPQFDRARDPNRWVDEASFLYKNKVCL